MTRKPENALLRLNSLTGLRFFAAFHVVLFHEAARQTKQLASQAGCLDTCLDFVPIGFGGGLGRGIAEIGASGFDGVSLFFILSGFILVFSYLDAAQRNHFSPREFWVARFARIYPVYLLGLIIWLPYSIRACVSGNLDVVSVVQSGVLNLFLLQAWWPPDALTWNFPGWSLSVEAFFYLLFPWILLLVRRQTSAFGMVVGACALCFVLPLAVAGIRVLFESRLAYSEVRSGWIQDFVRFFPPLRLPEFLLGAAVGNYFLTKRKPTGSYSGNPWLAFCLVLLLIGYGRDMLGTSLRQSFLPLAFAWLIYSLAARVGVLSGILSWWPVVLLGEASYSIYILHEPVAQLTQSVLRHALHQPGHQLGYGWTTWALCGYILIVLFTSLAVFRWIEIPLRSTIRRHYANHLLENKRS